MIKKSTILLLAVILLSGCQNNGQIKKNVPDSVKNAYSQALYLTGKKEYDKAGNILENIIRRDDKYYPAYKTLVKIYAEKKEWDRGDTYFRKLDSKTNPFPAWALGLLYDKKGLYEKAAAFFKKSVEIDNSFFGAYTGLVNIEFKKAAGKKKVLKEAEHFFNGIIRAEPANAAAHYGLGYLFARQYKYDEALAACKKALNCNSSGAYIYHTIGTIHYFSSNLTKSIENSKKALLLYKELGDITNEEVILYNIGLAYHLSSKYQQAIKYYEESYFLAQKIGDRIGENRTLSNIGTAHIELSNYSQSLDYFDKAMVICKQIGDKKGESFIINNIGFVYEILSDYKKALRYYEKSLLIRREIGDKRGEGITLCNIGIIYLELSRYSRALEYLEKALLISNETGERNLKAIILNTIGSIYLKESNYQEALAYFERVLGLQQEYTYKDAAANAMNYIGTVHTELKNYKQALKYYKNALNIRKNLGERKKESETLTRIGNVYLAQQEYTKALPFFQEAMVIIESLRDTFKNEQIKTGFFEKHITLYEKSITSLYELHLQNPSKNYDTLAFTYAEKSKARGLLDLLTEAKADIRQGIDPELHEEEKQLEQEYSRINTNLQEELSKPDNSVDSEKTAALKAELAHLEDRFDLLKQKTIRKNPRYARIKYPEPVTIEEVQKNLLDETTVLLEYKVTKEALYGWRITKEDYRFFKLEITEEELSDRITALRNAYTSLLGPEFYAPLSNKLYTALLEPMLAGMENKKNLLIIPDGILHYLPFETLVKETYGEKEKQVSDKDIPFLIKNYTISYAQSAGVACSSIKHNIQSAPAKSLFAMGDPVFSCEKNSEAALYTRTAVSAGTDETKRAGLARLIYSGEEVQNISSLFKKPAVYLRGEAREERIKEPGLLENYRYIHLAAHGILNENNPQFSGIILTQDADPAEDGYLQTREIFNLKLNADLVVLSACQTGLGKNVKGEGIVGLTRAWMYAGTQSVAVSLWPVDDKSTSYLMEHFYGHIKEGFGQSQALKKAKLALIGQPDGKFSHPVYWAPFVLLGGK